MADDVDGLEEDATPSIEPAHANEELERQLATTVNYALKQGLTETHIRRVVEKRLNEARNA